MAGYTHAMVYGGYGEAGRNIAALLATELGMDVAVAGRNLRAAEETALALAAKHRGCAFRSAAFDIIDPGALKAALAGIDLLIVSAPVAEHMGEIGRAALEAGTDMLDILVLPAAADTLMPLADAAKKAGRIFVTQAGFHPGVPGPLMRAVAAGFSRVQAIHVGMAMRVYLREPNSIREIVPEIVDSQARVLDNGVWRKANYRDARSFGFGAPFGRQTCYPMDMREIETVGAELGLTAAGVYVAGFNWFIDYVVFPLMMLAHRIGGMPLAFRLAPLMYWGNKWFTPKGQFIEIRAEATGDIKGRPATHAYCLSSKEPYALTAHCVVAAVKQMIEGPLGTPGVWPMGETIDHRKLFADLQALGARVWEERAAG